MSLICDHISNTAFGATVNCPVLNKSPDSLSLYMKQWSTAYVVIQKIASQRKEGRLIDIECSSMDIDESPSERGGER
jgi:hypothetical protein